MQLDLSHHELKGNKRGGALLCVWWVSEGVTLDGHVWPVGTVLDKCGQTDEKC